MDTEFGKKFTTVMANFFSRMVQGLENLSIDGIKIKDGIILLNYIQNQEQVTMSDVKNFLDTNPSTATRRVDALFSEGLVERVTDDNDRRIVYISVTEKGHELHHKFFSNRLTMLSKFMEHISEDEAQNFIRVVEKFLILTSNTLEFSLDL